ncbi:MAG: hypothetical protein JO235_13085 [Chroococcidiopsidaceae cyanobacterium CP_BM_RX_35]|nr:hypothetical protein [Chroococcidiopsidaceae cyanobacterium CP_BM_RX_35]
MNKSQAPLEQSTSQTRALLTPRELSALTGISMASILNAATKGNRYFRAWMRSEEGTWDFEVLAPDSKKPRRRFYRVD